MKTEKEIREEIKKVTEGNRHVLDCGLATIDINAPRALIQLAVMERLNALYYVLGEKRPRFECDDSSKINM